MVARHHIDVRSPLAYTGFGIESMAASRSSCERYRRFRSSRDGGWEGINP